MGNKVTVVLLAVCLVVLVFAGKLYVSGHGHRGALTTRGSRGSQTSADAATVEIGGSKSYVLVIDCGSSGTRMNAFEFDATWNSRTSLPSSQSPSLTVPTWIPSGRAPAHLIPKRSTETRRAYQRVETEPGLSSFVREHRLHEIDDKALQPLLAWARAVVPSAYWAETPVYLLGTAGLRRLEDDERERVLGACREVLARSPFRFENSYARVIDGKDEGMYGWAALNAAEGKLGVVGKEAETIGALDLGGSSLEVTYGVSGGGSGGGDDGESWRELRVGDVTYQVRTTSYAGAGLDDAYRAAGKMSEGTDNHPCLNRGYGRDNGFGYASGAKDAKDAKDAQDANDVENGTTTTGTIARGAAYEDGTNEACYKMADAVVDELDIAGGLASSNLSTKMTKTMSKASTTTFAAMSGFYVVNHFFGLDTSASLADVRKATDAFCELTWDTVLAQHKDEMAVETYCFRGAYVLALLRELGVEDVILGYDDGSIGGWPMGFAALVAEGSSRNSRPSRAYVWTSKNEFQPFAMVVVVVVVIVVIVTAVRGSGERLERAHSEGDRGKFRRLRVENKFGSNRSLEGMEEGVVRVGGFTRSSTVSRKLNEM